MAAPPRWTQTISMQRNLTIFFRNNTIGPNDSETDAYEKYHELWPQNSKGNFSKDLKLFLRLLFEGPHWQTCVSSNLNSAEP